MVVSVAGRQRNGTPKGGVRKSCARCVDVAGRVYHWRRHVSKRIPEKAVNVNIRQCHLGIEVGRIQFERERERSSKLEQWHHK
jgi:hypothetical protein